MKFIISFIINFAFIMLLVKIKQYNIVSYIFGMIQMGLFLGICEYLKWGIFHIIFIIFLTITNYKVFGFEFTIMYLMLEIVSSIMGMRLELIKLLDKKVD